MELLCCQGCKALHPAAQRKIEPSNKWRNKRAIQNRVQECIERESCVSFSLTLSHFLFVMPPSTEHRFTGHSFMRSQTMQLSLFFSLSLSLSLSLTAWAKYTQACKHTHSLVIVSPCFIHGQQQRNAFQMLGCCTLDRTLEVRAPSLVVLMVPERPWEGSRRWGEVTRPFKLLQSLKKIWGPGVLSLFTG